LTEKARLQNITINTAIAVLVPSNQTSDWQMKLSHSRLFVHLVSLVLQTAYDFQLFYGVQPSYHFYTNDEWFGRELHNNLPAF